jgi:pilus assembly protein CpaE
MRCFVAGDDIATAKQISELLVQLGHDCPASRVVRLDQIVPAIGVDSRAAPTALKAAGSVAAASEGSPEIVVVVVFPDAERALAVVQDLRRRIEAPILAVGPATDTKLVLRALREGASEYIDQADLRPELAGALARLDSSEKAGRVIAVLAPSGGSGASLLAANVAVALMQKSNGCALIDLNLESGDLVPLLDLKPTLTLADLCRYAERLDFSLLQGCLTRHDSGVQLLTAPASIAEIDRVTPDAIKLVLSMAARHFPFVIVDVPHSYRPEQQSLLQQADLIVLVLRLDFISLRNTKRTLDFIQHAGISRDRVQIVVNRLGQAGEISTTQAEESLKIKILQSLPDDPKTVNRAINNGIPVILQAPSAKISRALVDLATRLAELKTPGG